MKRSAILKRKKWLHAKPGQGVPLDVLLALRTRCNGVCEVCGERPAEHPHHKLRRSQGGKHTLDNLLCVDAICHRQIHDNPAWAYDQGYMIRAHG